MRVGSCSRAVVRRTLVRGQLFARPFFASNVVRCVSCSPDSYAHGQLAAQQTESTLSTGRRVGDSGLLRAMSACSGGFAELHLEVHPGGRH